MFNNGNSCVWIILIAILVLACCGGGADNGCNQRAFSGCGCNGC